MRPIRAEFKHQRRLPRWLWGVPVLLLIGAAVLWGLARHRQQAVEVAHHAAAEEARRQAAERAAAAARPPAAPAYEASAREMLRERLLPWPAALDAVEMAASPGVTLDSIEIDAREARVRLEFGVAGHEPLLAYLGTLNTGVPERGFAWRWTLQSVQAHEGRPGMARIVGAWAER